MPEPPPIWSDAFLAEEIRDQPEYKALVEDSAAFDVFVEIARDLLGKFRAISEPDEQLTIERVITPLLETLGWPSPVAKRRLTPRDEVDLVLYADEAQRELSLGGAQRDQVLGADGIIECKPWGSPFDTSGSGSRPGETATQQIQRYLLIAGTDSNESLRWGILTNGARWRIYSYRARPRDRAWEIDLERLLVAQDLFTRALDDDAIHQLRLAWLLLRRDSWIPAAGERESFLDRLLAKGRHADEQVAASLSKAIFSEVYPDLVAALWRHDEHAAADQVANAALTILYRLLFIFYAEDRGMLNTEDPRYREYSLRHGVREPAVSQLAAGNPSSVFTRFWDHLATLTEVLDHGNPEMGLPPYDGGLFATDPGSLLAQTRLTDAQLAPIIKALSHTEAGDYISYRNLEIQQLGSIYERLLERVPQHDDAGQVEVVVSPYARKDSGSYYTPQELVDLIVEQTLRPLLDERIAAFDAEPTEANDPAAALLRLKILDPAMGSGHFLITAIDWLTAAIEDLLDRSDNGNDSGEDGEPSYVSPVQAELDLIEAHRSAPLHPSIDDAIRAEIEQRRALGDQLPSPDRQSLIRRMVLKRCIYGVDKNPMAVELAKVALWLHSFAPPLPLPYLNHRIRAGDSLLGISIDAAHDYLAPWGPDHIARGLFADLAALSRTTAEAADALDANLDLTIIAIGESFRNNATLIQNRARLRKVLNLTAGLRWLSTGMKKAEREAFHAPLTEAISGHPGRADAILHNGENDPGLTPATPEFHQIRDQANEIADRENIFHWQVEFPHVMDQGGFDAIVTNPPWDRIKLQEVEWWAARQEDVAKAPTAAVRKEMIADLRAAGAPLVAEYDEAVERAAQLSLVFRKGGNYPLLGQGDINSYSLFVERSMALLKPTGVAGLLVPSGIYADKTAADYFRFVTTSGRLAGIYDFENRRQDHSAAEASRWFPDVHLGYKFCALIFGGAGRSFTSTRCGFFLQGNADLSDPSGRVFALSPSDFARINPNTHTAPIFRNRRDADLIGRIYRTHPVLVDRSRGDEQKLWPIRYHTMFHMSMDSELFQTREHLDEIGAYPVDLGQYKRGEDLWLPLYQGRMIGQFDHRANSVGYNPANIRRKYVSIPTSGPQHEDASFTPSTQYWVPRTTTAQSYQTAHEWLIAYRRSTKEDNERGMIAAVAPAVGYSDSVFLLMPDDALSANDACLIVGNLNAVSFDFVVRRKVHGVNLSKYLIEQMPMVHPRSYNRQFGETTARDLICDHVLRLSYTAHDLAPFARDLGYAADPFPWDPEERRQLRARLDALYFHLYGLDEQDTAYILDQFPVLEKNERKAHNRYQTKELVLAYHRALAAGDTANTITLPPTPPDS